jgi:hypothetical protein
MKRIYSFVALIAMSIQWSIACPPTSDSLFAQRFPYMESMKQMEPDFDVVAINAALDLVESTYADYLRPAGVEFSIKRDFSNNYKNAHPRREGSKWFIDLYGGTFNRSQVKYSSVDFAYLLACHEIGHHLAGTNFYYPPYEWAAGEGQSDYYSSLKCMRRVLQNTDNQAWLTEFETSVAADAFMNAELGHAKTACQPAWADPTQFALCVRSAVAGVMFSVNFDEPAVSIATPSTERTSATYIEHPVGQCRVDSFLNGARCSADYLVETDLKDPTIGTCPKSETLGLRPACWYVYPEPITYDI